VAAVPDDPGHGIERRYELDALLAHEGGHIGYGVVPSERRKAYATQILIQSLDITRSAGVQRVLVTRSVDNEGSTKVMQRCGGVFDSVVVSIDASSVNRFWIQYTLYCHRDKGTVSSPVIRANIIAISPMSACGSSRVQLRAQRRHRNYCNPIWPNVAVTTWRDHTEHAWFAGQRVIDLGRKLQK
jgi:hypothetical protein